LRQGAQARVALPHRERLLSNSELRVSGVRCGPTAGGLAGG